MYRVLAAAMILVPACCAAAQDVTLETLPPVVVKTVPEAGTTIEAGLKEIKVTFSKDMADGAWTWATHPDTSFPKIQGKPKFLADRRTCVLPVQLQPGTTYAIWINHEKTSNFKDGDGRPTVPYLLVFQTKK